MIRLRHIATLGICVLMLCASFNRANAQQDPMFTQYMFNTLALNPAYAGSADIFTVMALSRHQWVGLEGAPTTQTFVLHTPLKNQNIGLGFSVIHDKIGPVQQTGFYGDFAYRLKTGKESRLAFGLKFGGNYFTADLSSLQTIDDDPANVNVSGEFLPNAGFGLYWSSKKFYLGASAPKLLQNEIGEVNTVSGLVGEEERHYYLIGGMVFNLSEDLKFKPSFMARAVEGAPLSIDVTASFLLREKLWVGVMYRLQDSFGAILQYQISEQLRAGYAYDMTTSRLGEYNSGTHEIMLNYDLRFTKGRTISPRYF